MNAVAPYGRPWVDGQLLDRLPGVKVVRDHGLGVDQINLAEPAGGGF